MQFHIHPHPNAVADAAASFIASRFRALDRPGSIGLAGGSTPEATYRALRSEHVPWDQVDLWLTDERWVPPSDPEANAGMVRHSLADHVPAKLHVPDWSIGDPEVAAAAYEVKLETFMSAPDGSIRPDIVMLGIGDDGHTASLFPGDPAVDVTDRNYVATFVAAKDAWRLSATRPLLSNALVTVFIVTGDVKADTMAQIIERGERLPAGLVATEARDAHWFLDEAAAARLPSVAR